MRRSTTTPCCRSSTPAYRASVRRISMFCPSMIRCVRAISRTTRFSIGSSDWAGRNRCGIRSEPVPHHQVVIEADKEARLSRIALTPGAAAKLQVHPMAFVAVRSNHVEPAQAGHARSFRLVFAAKLHVGASARHVGRDRHRAKRTSPGDYPRLRGIVLRVQHFARHARVPHLCREALRFLHGQRPDQDRPAGRRRPLIAATTARSFASRWVKIDRRGRSGSPGGSSE